MGETPLASAEQLAQMVAALGVVVYEADAGGHLRWVSENVEAVFGVPREALLASPLEALHRVHPADFASAAQARRRQLAIGGTFRVEYRLRSADGAWRWVSDTGRRAPDDADRVVGMVADIDERRTLTEQLLAAQRNEPIVRLTRGVAHALNNELITILSFTHLAEGDLPSGSAIGQDLAEVRRAADRAASLVRHLSAIAHRVAEQPTLVDLADALRSLDRLLRWTLGEDVEFTLLLEDDVPPVFVSRVHVEQLVLNLVLNARDATGAEGHIVVRVDRAEAGARLTVHDDGEGMTDDVLAHAFEPLFTTKGAAGTGLGLPMVREIVELAGGRLSVESEPGAGTTFEVVLPPAPASAARPASVSSEPSPAPPARGYALVVEDQPQLRRLMARLLTGAGFEVRTAHSAEQALAGLASEDALDLLVSDVVLPGRSGVELAEAMSAAGRHPALVLVSGYVHEHAPPGDVGRACVFLPKPFGPTDLLEAVEQALA